jgi:hypothetical protein
MSAHSFDIQLTINETEEIFHFNDFCFLFRVGFCFWDSISKLEI